MSEAKLTYLGPLSSGNGKRQEKQAAWRRMPWPFLVVVVIPTLVAAVYYLVIASPRYVSEARFIVRAQAKETPSSLGMALQGVGLASAQSDAFAVHEYMKSRDALVELQKRYDIRQLMTGPGADPFSRLPKPWEGGSQEEFYKGFQKFVVVGYDSTNGMSTLRVEAFRPEDARNIANGLLEGGERLANRLNIRASQTAVAEAERALADAESQLAETQARLTVFRNQERFIDPKNVAEASSKLLGGLMLSEAELSTERAQIAASAPASPQLPMIDDRLRAVRALITAEQAKIAGFSNSLAPKIGEYEALAGARELAQRNVATTAIALNSARQDARRQQLYLERVVSPNLPDKAAQPKRLLAILAVFATAMLFYGVGWLIWAGVREHQQG